jgi:hypothetical protein
MPKRGNLSINFQQKEQLYMNVERIKEQMPFELWFQMPFELWFQSPVGTFHAKYVKPLA